MKAQKLPPGSIVVGRYNDAFAALKEYFAYPSAEFLCGRALELRTDHSGSDWARKDRQLSADAIEACSDLVELLKFAGIKVVPCTPSPSPVLRIKGVAITVRPDFLLKDETHGDVVGGLKFSFNKQYALEEDSCSYVATLLRHYLIAAYPGRIDPGMCLSIAPTTKNVVKSPRAYKTRMSAVEAACEEIAARWSLS